ncbi:MAG TPA: universal stress protein [Terriglobales bacterium]|nr:universal stress protein [Terriglobales bacterium]
MTDFKRILFPVDMSEEDRKAAPFVTAMAGWFGSRIDMLYVHEFLFPSYSPPEDYSGTAVAIAEECRRQRQAEFDTFLNLEFASSNLHKTMVDGEAAHEIVSYAKANDVGLIMMPTHGYSPFRRFLLGSVTAKILHDVACPVWTGVHTAELLSEHPDKCDRLLCAIDIQPEDARLIRWAAEFSSMRHCKVQLVHAVQGAPDTDDEGEQPFREFLFKAAHDAISALQKDAGTAFQVCVRGGKPEHVIHDSAQDLGADLVVIGRGKLNHPLGRLRTHTYSIIRESPRPVISI